MKKWVGVLAGLVLTTLLFSACSGSGGDKSVGGKSDVKVPEGATEVVMWNLFAGGDAEYMQNIVDKFNESQSDYFVNNVQQDYDQYYTKLLTSIGSGKGPDLAIAHTHVLPEFVNQGLVTNLGDYASEVGISWDDYNKTILDATVFDGVHYAVPNDVHPEIMFVNNQLVDEAGLLNEDGSLKMKKTPEGFMNFFTTLKKKLPEDKIPLSFSSAGEDPYRLWWQYYIELGGEHILTGDMENPKVDLDVDKAVKAAKFIKSFYHEKEIVPLNIEDFYSVFQSKKAAAIITGVWATGTWESTDGLEFTPVPSPNIFGQKAAWGDSHTFILPYYKNPDKEVQKGAVEFMKFATDHGAMWAKAGHIPSETTVVKSDEFQEIPYRSEYAEVADYVHYEDRTIYERGLRDIVIPNLDKIWAGDTSAEEAFSTIESDLKDLISK